MSKTLQIEVDPLLCASQERVISGDLPYAELKHMQKDVDSSSSPIVVELMFSKVRKYIVLTGRISADLVVQCAACLELTDIKIDIDVKLALINREGLMDSVPDGYEPYLFEGEKLLMSELIEGEVVLMLPSIARHDVCPIELPNSSTSKDFMPETEVKKNPFEALAGFKKH